MLAVRQSLAVREDTCPPKAGDRQRGTLIVRARRHAAKRSTIDQGVRGRAKVREAQQ